MKRDKQGDIVMLDQLEGLKAEDLRNLSEEEFVCRADSCIRKGDMASFMLLADLYPAYWDKYLLEELIFEMLLPDGKNVL